MGEREGPVIHRASALCPILSIFLSTANNKLPVFFFNPLLTINYLKIYQLSHTESSVFNGQDTRRDSAGCLWLRVSYGLYSRSGQGLQSLRGSKQGVGVGGGSSSSAIIMAAGRPPVLAGWLLET